jgi:hypothetical protein
MEFMDPWSGDVQMTAWDWLYGSMQFVRRGFGGVSYFRSVETHNGRHTWAVSPGRIPELNPRGTAR